jgi:hypothetical protein
MDSSGPGALDKQTSAEKRLMKDSASGAAYLIECLALSYLTEEAVTYPVTWDYVQKNSAITCDETWEPRYTYRITGNVTVSATLTILPGTTVKLDPVNKVTKQITISTNGKVIAKGEPYNYITFTNSSDDNCGEPIPGAPTGGWWKVLDILSGSSYGSLIQYCKFGHGHIALHLRTSPGAAVAHNIFNDMNYAIRLECASVTVHNNLITDCIYYAIWSTYVYEPIYTNNTIHGANVGIYDYGSCYVTATDNLFSNCSTGIYVGNYYSCDVHHNRYHNVPTFLSGASGDNNIELQSWPYDNSAIGNYFLNPANAEYEQKLKDNGSRTPRDAGLSESFFTVLAPTTVSESEYTGPVTWSAIQHDTGNSVDIGYHHCRTDIYLESGLTVSGSSGVLTIEPGVVVGIRGDRYLKASNQGKLLSVGDPSAGGFNVIACSKSLSMNIESPRFADTDSNPYVWISTDASEQCRLLFTRTMWLGWGVWVFRDLDEPIRDNVFSLSYYGIHASVNYCQNKLFNNLVYHNYYGAHAIGGTEGKAEVSNCTFDWNTTGLKAQASGGGVLPVRDSLFTRNSVEGICMGSGSGEIRNHYNAFYGNGEHVSGGSLGNGSQILPALPYEAGIASDWQQRYRIDQDSPVVDAGSIMAGDAGLAAYTTASDSRYDTRHVDTGFHFLARKSLFVGLRYQGDPDGSPLRPYSSVEAALLTAQEDMTVLVLPGTYDYLEENKEIVAKSHVDIIGSGHGATILDAHDVRVTPGQSHPLIVIDGKTDITVAAMTITRRYNEDWYTAQFHGEGGAMICRNSTHITVRDCLVTENDADWGGGFFIDNSAVTIEDCIIHQNRAISGKAGGGLYIKSCSRTAGRLVTLRRCIISNNTAGTPDEVQDLTMGGGGVYCTLGSDPKIVDCTISQNRASAYGGGGIYLDQDCSATIWNCLVHPNMSTRDQWDDQYKGDGGGIYVKQCSPGILGCTISDNTSIVGGTGIRCVGPSCSPLIANCTVAYNSGPQGTSAIYCDAGASPTILNCIAWGNGDDLYGCSATNSCIQEDGASDPLLVGSEYGPYHIADDSWCKDAGTTAGLPSDFTKGRDVDGDYRVIGAIDIGSDERHPFRQMIGIKRVFAQNKVTITWRTDTGVSYGVYRSTDPFTNYMSWGERATVQGNGGVVSWDDTQVSFASGTQAYYKVLAQTGSYVGQFSRPVGLINADVEDIDTDPSELESAFMAIPLELKYQTINAVPGRVDEGLGSMIAGYLQGEHLEQDDQMEFLKLGHPDLGQAWSHLQLKWIGNEPKWYDGAVESDERFSLGEAFRIVGPPTGGGAQGSRSTITFLGFVPSCPVGLLVFRTPTWGIRVEFGYPYPVDTSLNDIPFIQYGALPWVPPSAPDEVEVPTPPSWKELWLDTDAAGSELWMDGGIPAASPEIDVIPGKGFRYYGIRDERLVPPFEVGNNIYYYCVPVVRPYRCQ